MNFFGDGSDAWDSTPTQEVFIQNYFRKDEPKSKRSRKRKKHLLSSGTVAVSLMSNYLENEIPKQKNLNKKSKLTSTSCLKIVSEKSSKEESIDDSVVTSNCINKSLDKNSEFKSSKPRSPKNKILAKKFCKNSSKISEYTEKDSNDINLDDKSPKQDLQNNNSPSKKVNFKKNNKSIADEAFQNMSFVGETNFQLETANRQNLKKIKSKSNNASKIQNKPSATESNSKTKNLKVSKKINNFKENGLNVRESDDCEVEVSHIDQQTIKKRKLKTSKLSKTDESEDYENKVFQKKRPNRKKKKSRTGKKLQTDELDDSEDEVPQNDIQKQKKSKTNKASTIKTKSSANETTNLKSKKVKGSKNLSNSNENCLNVDDSEDDEAIRNELQNTRMFQKIQKLMKAAPHLNPNFHKDLAADNEHLSLEEISTEDSSSESDGEYASESENEEVLKNNAKHVPEGNSEDSSNDDDSSIDNEEDSMNDNEDESLNDNEEDSSASEEEDVDPIDTHPSTSKQEIPIQKLEMCSQKTSNVKKPNSMLEKARAKLAAAKFRYLNEKLYTESGGEAFRYFQENKEEFEDYHLGYGQQVSKWPLNPVDVILADLQKMNKNAVIADLGCGEAKIARVLTSRKVHSFDVVAMHKCVTSCDISKVPLRDGSVDVAVFCLSLMGVNLVDYLREAYRILKIGGTLKIAEVESRIENLDLFIRNLGNLGFVLERKILKHKLFVFLDLKKEKKGKQAKGTTITLRPCMYKKR